jgi:predicted transcriptional regulator
MGKATENFETYIDFWIKFKPSAADKVMFCIYRGYNSPRALIQKLCIAKGNLANCCRQLITDGKLTQHTSGRTVEYELTPKGQGQIKKYLEKAQ